MMRRHPLVEVAGENNTSRKCLNRMSKQKKCPKKGSDQSINKIKTILATTSFSVNFILHPSKVMEKSRHQTTPILDFPSHLPTNFNTKMLRWPGLPVVAQLWLSDPPPLLDLMASMMSWQGSMASKLTLDIMHWMLVVEFQPLWKNMRKSKWVNFFPK